MVLLNAPVVAAQVPAELMQMGRFVGAWDVPLESVHVAVHPSVAAVAAERDRFRWTR